MYFKKIVAFLYEKSVLILPVIYILFCNSECFFKPFIPAGDTLYKYENFYFFYNEFFYKFHIAQWTPFCGFGMPAGYYQLDSLSPSSYFVFLLGKLLRIIDVSVLFKLSVFIEHLILLLGGYLLSREVFKSKITTFIVCISLVSIPYWDWQIDFQLQLRYLLPLTLYFFLISFKRAKAEYFWLGLISTILSGIGNTPYIQFLNLFSLFIFNLFLWWQYKNSWKFLKMNLLQIFLFFIFIILLFCIYYQFDVFRQFVITPTRENGQKNSLLTFLTWWGGVEPGSLNGFFNNNIFGKCNLYYLGILPTLLLIYSIFTVRLKDFFLFLLPAVAMLWISFGGVFATVSYYFPGIAYYRHIGYAYTIYNVFLIFCAGFGLDKFLELSTNNKIKILLFMPFILVFLADGLNLRISWIANLTGFYSPIEFFKNLNFTYEYFRIGIYLIAVIFIMIVLFIRFFKVSGHQALSTNDIILDRLIKSILVCCFLIDVNSYMYSQRIYPKGDEHFVREVNKPVYKSSRYNYPKSERESRVVSFIASHRASYEPIYNVAQFSPCNLGLRQLIPKNIVEFEKLEKVISKDNLAIITACEYPKLRLIPNAVFSPNLTQTERLFKSIPDFSTSFILGGSNTDFISKNSYQNDSEISKSEIKVISFSTDAVKIETDVSFLNGAWLVYSDSFHPSWEAKVNGKDKKIYPANLAFKAIHLDKGRNVVQWVFNDRLSRMASYLIALISLFFCSFLLGWFIKEIFNIPKSIVDKIRISPFLSVVGINIIVFVVIFLSLEIFFRIIKYDFGESVELFKSLPIYYRQPTVPVGSVFFRREGPDRWTGKPLLTGLHLYRYSDNAYTDEKEISITYDKNGFRNSENLKNWDVVVVGDSFVEQGQLPYDNLITTQLGRILGVKVKNLGVSYTGPLSYNYYLKEYGKSSNSKHAIMVFFEGNDVSDLINENNQIQNLIQTGQREYRNFQKQTSLAKAIKDFFRSFPRKKKIVQNAFFTCKDKDIPITLNYAPPGLNDLTTSHKGLIDSALMEWAKIAKNEGMTPWVIFMPSKERVFYKHLKFTKDTPVWVINWKPTDLSKFIRFTSEKNNIGFIDVGPDLIKENDSCDIVYNTIFDTHLNSRGSRVVAEVIARYIKDNY